MHTKLHVNFLRVSPVPSDHETVKIANRKARLLVQIERKRVSLERRPCSDIFDQKSSVVLSALLTSKRAGKDRRSGPGDFSS